MEGIVIDTNGFVEQALFCFYQGAIWGGFVPLGLTWFAVHFEVGFAIR
jgi:hypothetical protein